MKIVNFFLDKIVDLSERDESLIQRRRLNDTQKSNEIIIEQPSTQKKKKLEKEYSELIEKDSLLGIYVDETYIVNKHDNEFSNDDIQEIIDIIENKQIPEQQPQQVSLYKPPQVQVQVQAPEEQPKIEHIDSTYKRYTKYIERNLQRIITKIEQLEKNNRYVNRMYSWWNHNPWAKYCLFLMFWWWF